MEYTRLGRSGLRVSRIGLGCMSYGQAAAGMHQWTLDEDAAAPFFRQAVELGVTFWDTANVYQGGTSEEFVGRAIAQVLPPRGHRCWPPRCTGRCTTARAAAACPARRFWSNWTRRCAGWAPTTSTCTTSTVSMTRCRSRRPWQALHDVVKAGKVRYLGASSMWAWQFAKMQHAAAVNGWTTFSAMEDQYNVLKREEERDMIPLCLDQGVGLTPYSPLAKGRATRPWGEQTARSSADAVAKAFDREADKPVVDAIHTIADARGVPMAQIALAWVLSKPVVSCPIVGATKPHHLTRRRGGPRRQTHRRRDRGAGTAVHRPGQLLVVIDGIPDAQLVLHAQHRSAHRHDREFTRCGYVR